MCALQFRCHLYFMSSCSHFYINIYFIFRQNDNAKWHSSHWRACTFNLSLSRTIYLMFSAIFFWSTVLPVAHESSSLFEWCKTNTHALHKITYKNTETHRDWNTATETANMFHFLYYYETRTHNFPSSIFHLDQIYLYFVLFFFRCAIFW